MSARGEYPCNVELAVRRYQHGALDAYGNPRAGYGAPETAKVFAVVVGGAEDPTQTHPEAAEHTLKVYAPASLNIGDRDRIVYQGSSFEVDGRPGDWDANPWWSPGLVEVRCKEVLG